MIALGAGIYGDSQFYRGAGEYYLTNTCNKWTAKALQSAGMDISPGFKLTADSVMGYIKEWQQEAANAGAVEGKCGFLAD